MKKINLLMVFGTVVLFCGCANPMIQQKSPTQTTIQSSANQEPVWINNPVIEGKIAGSGCAKAHFKGISYQKKLAVQRAIEQIAIQKDSQVSTVSLSQKNRNSASSYSQTSMSESKVNLSTTVKEYYTKDDGEICAWVILNQN